MAHEPEYRVVPQSVLQALSTVEVEPAVAGGPLVAGDGLRVEALSFADITGALVWFLPSDDDPLTTMQCVFPQASASEGDVIAIHAAITFIFDPGGIAAATSADITLVPAYSVDGGTTWLSSMDWSTLRTLAANGNAEPADSLAQVVWSWAFELPPVTGDVIVRLFAQIATPNDAILPTVTYEQAETPPNLTCYLLPAAAASGLVPLSPLDVTLVVVDAPPIV